MSAPEEHFLWRLARRCQLGLCLQKEQEMGKDETLCKVGALNVSLSVTFEMVETIFQNPGAIFGHSGGDGKSLSFTFA